MTLIRRPLLSTLLVVSACSAPTAEGQGPHTADWQRTDRDGMAVQFTARDAARAAAVLEYALAGRERVASFYQQSPGSDITVRVYPSRAIMEPEWRAIFQAPQMVFQCWMIANANDSTVLMLSPNAWAAETCGHDGSNSAYIAATVVHELVHVLHRRLNPNRGLQGMATSWWLVEGLATYASGQFDTRLRGVASDALRSQPPRELALIMQRSDGYALAASLVACLDDRFGRSRLVQLMRARNASDILTQLATTEAELIQTWRACVAAW